MAIFVVENIGGIETGALPSGDMKVWHPINENLRAIVEGICRHRGYWEPKYNNWVVKSRFVDVVLSELSSRAKRIA